MKRQCINFLNFRARPWIVLSLIAGVIAPAFPATAAPSGVQVESLVTRTSWLEQFIDFMDLLFQLMGGDQETIRKASSASEKVAIFAGFYASNGLGGVDANRRDELATNIRALYQHLQSEPNGLDPVSMLVLKSTLVSMWLELGRPLEELRN